MTISDTEDVEDIDFRLKLGATVSGRVFDAVTGLPVARMDLYAGPVDGDDIAWARTDRNGNYTLQGIPDGVIEIGVDGRRGYIEERQTVTVRGRETVTGLDFGVDVGATISGQVTDIETGLPVPNIHVRAEQRDGPSTGEDTDSDRRYVLRGIAPGDYVIRAEGDRKGYIRALYDNQSDWDMADMVIIRENENVGDIDFALRRGATISGRVIDDETGSPISDMEVWADAEGRGGSVSWGRTGPDGTYVLRGLPTGVMEVGVRGRDYIEERVRIIKVETQVATASDIRMRRGGTISGRVIDTDTGDPLADVGVSANRVGGAGDRVHEHTGSDGRYLIRGVAPGTYVIETESEGQGEDYLQQVYDGVSDWENAELITITGREVLEAVDFRLTRGAAISGTVIDASTGQPIADMEISARQEVGDDSNQVSWSNTDSSGRYILRGVPNGVIEVQVRGQGYLEAHRTVTIRDGQDVTNFDF